MYAPAQRIHTHSALSAQPSIQVNPADAGPGSDPRLRLTELRKQVEAHLRHSPWRNASLESPRCLSGLSQLDRGVGGGFPSGIHEFIARSAAAPALSLAMHVATRAAAHNGWILQIDTTGDFYPPAAARLGIPLGRLLVIHARRTLDALWVCEQALRCRGIAAVVAPLRRLDAYASRRLQLAAEAGAGLGLLVRDRDDGGQTFATSRLRVDPLAGDTEVRRVLITVLKLREGNPPEPFELELPDAAGDVPAHALSADGPGTSRRASAVG